MKRILLVHPTIENYIDETPHLGLAMLSAVLKKTGHVVSVVDYTFQANAPSIDDFFKEFRPDVIGISLYTALMRQADKIIETAYRLGIPVVVGGPHATLYSEDLRLDKRINTIVRGQAEDCIVDAVENIEVSAKPSIIQCLTPDVEELPFSDFTSFYHFRDIKIYPLLTSRGCPYSCSFCAVGFVSSKRWRPRSPEVCIEELKCAKNTLPNLRTVSIFDDDPTFDIEHFKKFINLYIEEKIGLRLGIANIRADSFSDELIELLKNANCDSICIGVEHAHPEVFKLIEKGETLERIKETAKLIKKKGLRLELCFIIGLPGDTLKRTKYSIRLAQGLKPDFIYWNMMIPYKGTRARRWFERYGKLYSEIDHLPTRADDFRCDDPVAETPDFTFEERKKAYLWAVLETNRYKLRIKELFRLLRDVKRHGLYISFLKSLMLKFRKRLYRILRKNMEK